MGELFMSPFGMAQRRLDHDAVVIRNRRKSRFHFGFIWLDVRCNMGFYGHLLNPASFSNACVEVCPPHVVGNALPFAMNIMSACKLPNQNSQKSNPFQPASEFPKIQLPSTHSSKLPQNPSLLKQLLLGGDFKYSTRFLGK